MLVICFERERVVGPCGSRCATGGRSIIDQREQDV